MQTRARVEVTFLVPFSFRHFMKVAVKHSQQQQGGLPAGGRDDDDQKNDSHNHSDDRHHLHVLPPVLSLQSSSLESALIYQFNWTIILFLY